MSHFSSNKCLELLFFFFLDHCHSVLVSKPDVKARQRLLVASVLCLFFMIGEIIGN